MIVYNILSNFVLSILGISGFFSRNPLFHLQLLKYSTVFYYTTDTVMEIKLYSRYIFIPHHLIAILIPRHFHEKIPYNIVFLEYFLLESSSLITNIRHVLKTKQKLTVELDTLFYMYYILCRILPSPYIIHRLKDEILTYYSSLFLFLMSFCWTLKWTKSIVRKRKQQQKTTTENCDRKLKNSYSKVHQE